VKVKHRGSGIKGKQVNSIKDKKLIKKKVQGLINREIRYISTIFPYFDKSFYNRRLIYFQGVFLWKSLILPGKNIQGLTVPADNLVNLITGLELMGMGISFHCFDTADFLVTNKESIGESAEKKYTLKLLFGDIFYSRAVIYLLKFKDCKIFENILGSLKQVHESRLALHKEISGIFGNGRNISVMGSKRQLLLNANRLFRESFYLGYNIFRVGNFKIKTGEIFKIVNHLVVLLTYTNLENYFKALPESARKLKSLLFFHDKKDFINGQLNDIISRLNCERLRKAIVALKESIN
jgi:hypothetical protein